MSTYVIGDLQGCYQSLQQLLTKIDFSLDKDILWFTGDLVNRGPDSLKVLEFVQDLKENAVTVLGNHDLHMLAVLTGLEKPRRKDTLDEIQSSANKMKIIDWVRQQPLMHVDDTQQMVLLHAGCYPTWTIAAASQYAKEVESVLQSDQYMNFLKKMYGNQPSAWSETLTQWDRLRFITNCFTRMRYLTEDLQHDLKYKGAPKDAPTGLKPWFHYGEKVRRPYNILFGHWSTLGYLNENGVYSLDTGCLWGGKLTALKLGETPSPIMIDCAQILGID